MKNTIHQSNNSSTQLSDKELLKLCEEFGRNALLWRRKFIGLLPEVKRRRLYEKRGFGSIFEFAFKLAGLSEDQVKRVLNLDEKFVNKPALHNLLVSGNVSVNKLARIVSIATQENEGELAETVKILSQKTLETFVRDQKMDGYFEGSNGLAKPLFEAKSVRAHTNLPLNFELSAEVTEELNRLNSQGQDVNRILADLLDQRKAKIEQEKEEIAEEIAKQTISRHIPAKVRKILHQEFGTKCSIPNCTKPAQEVHHSQRFALAKTHDPRFLAPLCHEHHQLAHLIDQKYKSKVLSGDS
ncbi:MAG: hypothetical protein WC897_01235 [Candidatus Gracilibacteria bacterium]